jgi:hypothetical protein
MNLDYLAQDGQDRNVVKKVYERLSKILTPQERVLYIAVQSKVVGVFDNMSADCIAITNRRIIIYRPKLLGGANMDDFVLRQLSDVKIEEGMMRATLWFRTVDGKVIEFGDLIKDQARRLYSYTQHVEENMEEERRQRDLEMRRASVGGVIIQGGNQPPIINTTNNPFYQPSPQQPNPQTNTANNPFYQSSPQQPSSQANATNPVYQPSPQPTTQTTSIQADSVADANSNPMQKLKMLKEMLEADLISQQEYDSKKAEILANM